MNSSLWDKFTDSYGFEESSSYKKSIAIMKRKNIHDKVERIITKGEIK